MDKLGNIKVYRGNPLIMGATVMGDNVNFAITAKYGSKCEVILYRKGEDREAFPIPIQKMHQGYWECLCHVCNKDLIIRNMIITFVLMMR